MDLEACKKRFPLIDEIHYTDSMEDWFKQHQPQTVYVNLGKNTDSGLSTQVAEEKFYQSVTDSTTMWPILSESRVYKNDEEMEIMRWASKITCEAHCNVMRNVKPGQRESQLESFFKYHCEQTYFCGRVQPYTSICGCGPGAATLHYHDADKWLVDGQMMLTD